MNRTAIACTAIVTIGLVAAAIALGPLNPPSGAVTSTNKTLSEVEPRIAVNATNTPGDANALFRITSPGSYYLTGNLSIPSSARYAILIDSPNITLDLNGFSIDGTGSTAGGILVLGSSTHVTITNGSVRNTSEYGIASQNATSPRQLTVDRVRVANVARNNIAGSIDAGIRVGPGGIISNCSVTTATTGIIAGASSRVSNTIAESCTLSGFTLGDGSTAESCLAINVLNVGFTLSARSTAINCTSNGCGTGFYTDDACSIIDCKSSISTNVGIFMTGNGLVSRTHISGGATGIQLTGNGNRVERCKIGSATTGIFTSGADAIIDNTLNSAGPLSGDGITATGNNALIDSNYVYSFARGVVVSTPNNDVTRNRFHFCSSFIAGAGATGVGVAPVAINFSGVTNPLTNTAR